jgi:hypothetical protein
MKFDERMSKSLEELMSDPVFAAIPAEKRLRWLAPEQWLAGLSPEQRLAGLSVEQIVKALNAPPPRSWLRSGACGTDRSGRATLALSSPGLHSVSVARPPWAPISSSGISPTR